MKKRARSAFLRSAAAVAASAVVLLCKHCSAAQLSSSLTSNRDQQRILHSNQFPSYYSHPVRLQWQQESVEYGP